MQKVFQPAIALMNRLKYPQKFLLISCIFILPLSVLVYLLLSDTQGWINFTRKEVLGNAYLRPQRQLWLDIQRLQLLSYRDSVPQGQRSYRHQPEIVRMKSQVATSFQALENIDRKMGAIFLTTNKFKTLKQSWLNIQEDTQNSVNNPQYNLLIEQLDKLRVQVGEQSNLVLDPELDTYYLMEATTNHLPEMQRILSEVKLLTDQVRKHQGSTLRERSRLIMLLGILKNDNNQLKAYMAVVFKKNSAFYLRSRLTNHLTVFTKDIDLLSEQLSLLLDTNSIPNSEVLFTIADRNLKEGLSLWDQMIKPLDFLLQNRLNNLMRKQAIIAIFILIVLIIVLYFLIAFYYGVMQTVWKLETAAKQMVQGTLTEAITLDNRDELAVVVNSFNSIGVALVQTHLEVMILNERLKVENLRMGAELNVTRQLQEMILPQTFDLCNIESLDIACYMQPALEVGGDYYDVINQDGRVKIGIGDVTGHGLESGVLMIMVQTAVRTLLENNETDPKRFLNALNRTIYHNLQRMKSSKNLSLALLDYQDGIMRVSGQHEEIIIVRQSGKVELIDTMDLGFPIGLELDISDFINYQDVPLHAGDVVVLYTDGITEATNIHEVQYGIERLIEVVKQNLPHSAKTIKQAALADIRRHIGTSKIFDDITLLVMKKKPGY
jgi:serine phosphatase RsbU (regulator of sigma subunit)/methyl-accepting chemotaxis protein